MNATINTRTEITTAARRIARTSGQYALTRDNLVFDADGNLIGQPYKSDRTAYDAIVVTKKLSQREAQDLLDAHAAGAEWRASAVENGMFDADAYAGGMQSYWSQIQHLRDEEARLHG